MPPNLLSIAAIPFGDPQRTRLSAWLREAGWPRHHMEITELEGYLVALISWPVGISSGAWLPPVWGERGWKVPTKISGQSQYGDFIALIVGFMKDLDRQLSLQPSRFESTVLRGLRGRELAEALDAWGRGFMTALTMGSQGLKFRSDGVRAALHTIVARTTSSIPLPSNAVDGVERAVLSLIEQRTSRGPLGALEAVRADSPVPHSDIRTVKAAARD
jgi:yecA family protein